MILSLALIHHLAISNNVPLKKIAEFFKSNCRFLIIEFIPKSDSQVQRLLSSRKDIFDEYTQDQFEDCFKNYFTIKKIENISGSERIIYLMENKISL